VNRFGVTNLHCLRLSTAHVPAILKASDTISLVAIYSRSASSVEKLVASDELSSLSQEARSSIKQYSGDDGLQELLKRDDIHAVIVALPISKQPEVILQCLKAGKHVLSEVSCLVLFEALTALLT
jgi:predicted dehydrogenase